MSERPSPDAFPSRTHDKLRYNDTDRQGHVNNAVFSTFLETGRVEIFYRDPDVIREGCEFVIARCTLDFLGEIRWPGEVEICSGVKRLGTSSVNLEQAIFQDGEVVAHAETIIVQIDQQPRKSAPLSDKARTKLETLMMA
ncbi:MAG: thioesterase family protein [Limibacillus sp.]